MKIKALTEEVLRCKIGRQSPQSPTLTSSSSDQELTKCDVSSFIMGKLSRAVSRRVRPEPKVNQKKIMLIGEPSPSPYFSLKIVRRRIVVIRAGVTFSHKSPVLHWLTPTKISYLSMTGHLGRPKAKLSALTSSLLLLWYTPCQMKDTAPKVH
jgi:hypothetical protein